ncbi:MAG: helix-turn-helix domain-containing protein, partial [bacterium]|nr:helix-turn-helix domain-containing protein [bacterium]
MVNGFKKRLIATDKSLGEFLKEARNQKEMTIECAETACKVKAKYLTDLEAGNWQSLPSLVYVRGFVLAYAKCLSLDKKEVEQLFWREYGFIDRQGKENLSYHAVLGDKKVLITQELTV